MTDGDFEFRILTEESLPETCRIIGQYMATIEPTSTLGVKDIAISIQAKEEIAHHPESQGLSVYAVHTPTGEICGGLLNGKCYYLLSYN